MQNMKDEISFRKIYEKSIIGLAKPELGEKFIYFSELSLFLQLSLSSPSTKLFLSQFFHDFCHLRPSSSPARATRWSSTIGLEDSTQNGRLSRSSSSETSHVSRVLLACSLPFRPPRRFNSPPPAWNHHEHPLAGSIHVCWRGCSFVRGSYDPRIGYTSYTSVAPRLDFRTSGL